MFCLKNSFYIFNSLTRRQVGTGFMIFSSFDYQYHRLFCFAIYLQLFKLQLELFICWKNIYKKSKTNEKLKPNIKSKLKNKNLLCQKNILFPCFVLQQFDRQRDRDAAKSPQFHNFVSLCLQISQIVLYHYLMPRFHTGAQFYTMTKSSLGNA